MTEVTTGAVLLNPAIPAEFIFLFPVIQRALGTDTKVTFLVFKSAWATIIESVSKPPECPTPPWPSNNTL